MSYNINKEGTWLTGARVVSSPNCDARPLDVEIDLLIIHAISLPPKEYGGGYIDKLFTNTLTPDEHPYFMKIKEKNYKFLRTCLSIVRVASLNMCLLI